MPTFDEIQRPIAAEMKAFEPHFREAMRSKAACWTASCTTS
jgi:hypothetical protein